MTALAHTERAQLADLLDASGPDAPTLCGDWTTRDLAAHLVARDRRPLSLPGLVVPALGGLTERTRRGLRDSRSYEDLVGVVRQGAPAWSPVGFPPTERAANAVEYFVHHEDVRRAKPGWEPRALDDAHQSALWRRLRSAASLLVRRADGTVTLRRADGAQVSTGRGEPHVVVTGEPAELMLCAFGRQEQARVEYEGDPTAVTRLRGAPLGF
ncbi:MAG: TIGR03085 family metal-binding protein [Actinomycetes bacterium]